MRAMKFAETLQQLKGPTAISLIAANTIPLLGAIFLDWTVFSLMFLFWIENVIIGLLNVVKLLGAQPDEDIGPDTPRGMRIFLLGLQIFYACFFTVHYGGFCMGHGVFVFAIFGKDAGLSVPGGLGEALKMGHQLLIEQKLLIAVIVIFISHLFSLVYNYFIKGERKGAELQYLMGRPYGRIIVLHITIIVGAIPVMVLGSPIWALVLLLILKTGVDLKSHLKERDKMAEKSAARSAKHNAR
jgi:hypothetical protein